MWRTDAMSIPPTTDRRPRVLVATASVGAGHNSAARAIVAGLSADAPHIDVRYLDVLPLAPWAFRAYYAGGYAMSVSLFPTFYGIGYWLTNRPQRAARGLNERLRLRSERFWMARFARSVAEFKPDLVINTHFLAPPLIGRMIARGELSAEQMVVITDNEAHRYWYAENVRRWFVAADCCVEPLTRWGIDTDKITVSGIPVHPKWLAPLDRAKVLADWNLPAEKPIVLLAGGAEFTCAPVHKLAAAIAKSCPNATVVVMAGNNKRLLERLAKLAARQPRIVPVSFTDRAHELVEACSLMVTKAGGITTTECLAKNTPMLLLNPVPGQEAANARYLTAQGAAVTVGGRTANVASHVARMLADDDALAGLSACAQRLYKPGTQTIVTKVRQMLS